MGKDEETEFKKPELLNDILEETEELIKIFGTSIKTAEKKSRLGVIGRSMFDVRRSSFKTPTDLDLRSNGMLEKLVPEPR